MQFSENSVLLNFYGGHKAVARPDPIPNSAVKHRIADGSACIACARVGCRRTFLITPFPLLTVFSDSGLGVFYFTRNVVHCLDSQGRKRNFEGNCFNPQKSRGKSQQSDESSNLGIYGDLAADCSDSNPDFQGSRTLNPIVPNSSSDLRKFGVNPQNQVRLQIP